MGIENSSIPYRRIRMKANCKRHPLACNRVYTEEEQRQYKEEVLVLYELGIDIYEIDARSKNMYYLDGVNTFKADEQLAIDLLLNKHEEIPDDLRTRLEYYKKIREQQEAEK